MGVHQVIKVTPDGVATPYAMGPQDNLLQRPNYPVFDVAGNLYVSDSRTGARTMADPRVPAGWTRGSLVHGLARLHQWHGAEPRLDHCLYVVETRLPGVSRITINKDGSAGAREVVARHPGDLPRWRSGRYRRLAHITCYAPDRNHRLRAGWKTRDPLQ